MEEKNIEYGRDNKFYNKTVDIKKVPMPEIGITDGDDFLDQLVASRKGISEIESLTNVARTREYVYELIDTMAQDPTISAALEIYAEDVTEPNDNGDVVWVTSENPDTQRYITFLLKQLNLDRHIYEWVYSLCKYGDCFIRLYKESEIEKNKGKSTLNEELKVNVFDPNSRFVTYVEQEKNPACMFELTRYGKTEQYIKADVPTFTRDENALGQSNLSYLYRFNSNDVNTYAPEMYVHGCLAAVGDRFKEEIELSDINDENKVVYSVNTGQSILYNTFKIWRQIQLLESSLLLNRLTKSSIVRLIGVEVGDMPKDKVLLKLHQIKSLFEQKNSINTGNTFQEYNNAGPMENNVYMPTRNGKGAITTTQIGGDVDVKGLADIDYFANKLYSSLKVPKQYLGDTDDATGFNGGTSLTIISSRYAKTVKRIQAATIQMVEDLINRFLLDRREISYIGQYQIHMQEPTTQEVMDRLQNMASNISYVQDIMNLIDIQDNEEMRLNILKELISKLVPGTDVLHLIDEYIESLEKVEQQTDDLDDMDEFEDSHMNRPGGGGGLNSMMSNDFSLPGEDETTPESDEDIILPSPAELDSNIDFTNNNEGE